MKIARNKERFLDKNHEQNVHNYDLSLQKSDISKHKKITASNISIVNLITEDAMGETFDYFRLEINLMKQTGIIVATRTNFFIHKGGYCQSIAKNRELRIEVKATELVYI